MRGGPAAPASTVATLTLAAVPAFGATCPRTRLQTPRPAASRSWGWLGDFYFYGFIFILIYFSSITIPVNFSLWRIPAQPAVAAGPPAVVQSRATVLPLRRWPPCSLPPPSRPLSVPAPAFRAVSVRWMCGPAEADMFQARSREEVSLATITKCERKKSSPGSPLSSGDS